MDSTTSATIEKLNGQIAVLEEQIFNMKSTINTLCALEGEQPLYSDLNRGLTAVSVEFRSDQFFGRPLATVVREILEQRASRNLGAISLDDLFDTMKAGGYQFDNSSDQIAKRNVAITLSKNLIFTRVPNSGNWGLAAWYPNVKKKKGADKENGSPRLTLADVE